MRPGVTMILPGQTEAGSAGMQPCRGIAWWAHRDDDRERGNHSPVLPPTLIGSKDPDASKIPARRAESTLTENARPPFQAEPEQSRNRSRTATRRRSPASAHRPTGPRASPSVAARRLTTLCRFAAHGVFIPSASSSTTSEGTPRIVEVIGAAVTVDK